MTKAEELAETYRATFSLDPMAVDLIKRLLEQYGRLVQEAAAKEANRVAGPGVVSPFSPADAIREMPLP